MSFSAVHFNILYSSIRNCMVLQSVSGQALEHLVVPKTQLSYSLMPAKKDDNALWVPYIATFFK